MELKEFAYKEELINDKGWGGIIIHEQFRQISFDEIDFENELVTYIEKTIEPEYGWFDMETHEMCFEDLDDDIYSGLVGLFKEIKA